MARIPHARGRALGWCDCPYRHMLGSISYKIISFHLKGFFTHALVKVNWLWVALMVGHQVPLSPLAFRASFVTGPSAREGTALP